MADLMSTWSMSAISAAPAGRLGGLVRCGVYLSSSCGRVAVCAWVGHSTMGAVVLPDVHMTGRQLEPLALAFRSAAEH